MPDSDGIDAVHRAAWKQYRGELLRFVGSRVKTPEVAEDIVHDALVKAHERWDQLERRGSLRSWLFQITRNAVIDHYRVRRETDQLPPDFADEPTGADSAPERELAQCLAPLIRDLPGHYRAAVEMTEIDGMTQREAAAELGLSVSGAKSRVQRARRMLEEALLTCCRVEFDSRGRVMDYVPRDACTDCEPGERDDAVPSCTG